MEASVEMILTVSVVATLVPMMMLPDVDQLNLPQQVHVHDLLGELEENNCLLHNEAVS